MLKTSGKPNGGQVLHLLELSRDEKARRLGTSAIDISQPLVAGENVTICFTFTLGETPIPVGGGLRVAWRWPLDWANLQTVDPASEGYLSATVTPAQPAVQPATLALSFVQRGDLDPWMHQFEARVTSGELKQGDRVQIECRDWCAPTCTASAALFLMLINPASDQTTGGKEWLRMPDAPTVAISPGPAVRLVVVAPGDAVGGEPFTLYVRGEDMWGNAAPLPGDVLPHLNEATEGIEVERVTAQAEPPAYHITLRATPPDGEATALRLEIGVQEADLHATSNPILIHAARPPLQLYWGDLHSGQTEMGCGAGTLAEHYTYARDVSGLQFLTHQANDHYMTRDDWQHTRDVTAEFIEQGISDDVPSRCIVYLGCEWSPLTPEGGDRNVIYRCDQERLVRSGRFFTEDDPNPEPDAPVAPEFHAAMREQVAHGQEILINMHVGGRMTNLDYHDPSLEQLAEIHSTHGTSEWFVEDALRRGYRFGITAGADGVMGRPGADHPGWRLCRNLRSGLTGVYATDLTHDALWEAFQARRCYGTTGERIRLWVEVDGAPMGAEVETDGQPLIRLTVEGTAAIERVDLLRGVEIIGSWQVAQHDSEWMRVLWSGTRSKGTARAQTLVWDGSLQITDGAALAVEAVGFHSSLDSVQIEDARRISWRSSTAGNAMGFRLRLDGKEQARFHFASEPATFDFSLRQARLAPFMIDAGPPNRRVTVGPAPRQDGAMRAELSIRDTTPLPVDRTRQNKVDHNGQVERNVYPYWVRVVQVDQAKAWSSPVYVTRR